MNIKVTISRSSAPDYFYGIVKHPAWIEYDPETNPGLVNTLPSAVQMHDDPNQSYKGASIRIYDNWWNYIKKINAPYPKGYDYAHSVGSLWCNIYEVSECVISGGNFVAWRKGDETNTHVKILTYGQMMDTAQLDPNKDNWFIDPLRFWKCSAYNQARYSFKVWGGVDSFIPQIKKTDCWIKKTDIQILPRELDYQFYGTDVYSNGDPMLIVDKSGQRVINKLGITVPGVVPPIGWKI